MDRLTEVTLITPTYGTDAIGQSVVASEATRTLICTLSSVTRVEWQAAAQQGLQPQFVCRLAYDVDYQGELIAEVNGTRYTIYRTFLTNDGGIELYLRRDAGPNL